MANIGSAFLGDFQAQRIRHLSSPTTSSPPASPPAAGSNNSNRMSAIQPLSPPAIATGVQETEAQHKEQDLQANPVTKTTIDPLLALELRLRWLEALVLGQDKGASKPTVKAKDKGKETATLTRLTEDVTKRLDEIIEVNDGLRRFMDSYDQHAQYLTPTFALSGIIDAPAAPSTPTSTTPDTNNLASVFLPSYANMSPAELEVYLMEMEPDVRAADRDMREIEALVGRGVAGAGKLGDYEALTSRLEILIKEHEEDMRLAKDLEKRVAKLVERHVTHVDALSELFVAWDDTLLDAENRTKGLEKDFKERQRLGLVP